MPGPPPPPRSRRGLNAAPRGGLAPPSAGAGGGTRCRRPLGPGIAAVASWYPAGRASSAAASGPLARAPDRAPVAARAMPGWPHARRARPLQRRRAAAARATAAGPPTGRRRTRPAKEAKEAKDAKEAPPGEARVAARMNAALSASFASFARAPRQHQWLRARRGWHHASGRWPGKDGWRTGGAGAAGPVFASCHGSCNEAGWRRLPRRSHSPRSGASTCSSGAPSARWTP
jgi:hypothetical protein